jgi:hypothetical protein
MARTSGFGATSARRTHSSASVRKSSGSSGGIAPHLFAWGRPCVSPHRQRVLKSKNVPKTVRMRRKKGLRDYGSNGQSEASTNRAAGQSATPCPPSTSILHRNARLVWRCRDRFGRRLFHQHEAAAVKMVEQMARGDLGHHLARGAELTLAVMGQGKG